MIITNVTVCNFRAHTDTKIPLAQIGCLIGENNAGKSSILHAIQFALDSRKVTDTDFKDRTQPLKVELTIENIDQQDLQRVRNTVHREALSKIITNGTLTLARTQYPDGKTEFTYLTHKPKNKALTSECISQIMRGKKGRELRETVVSKIPTLANILPASPTQKQINEAIQQIIENLPPEEMELAFAPFPTGISASFKPLLPEVIYIEAVKDASFEAKSVGSSAFASLLKLLFEEVNSEFQDITQAFAGIHEKLNRSFDNDGNSQDKRLPAVRKIEETIGKYVQSSFPGVILHMDVPAPTLNLILEKAELLIDDGHESPVSNKGDGLKRTVLFALLRAYTVLRQTGLTEPTERDASRPEYILLFEEPELYLHPKAQRQLMAALDDFSKDHQVLVTTHSPGFFRPNTKGFTRLHKRNQEVDVCTVDLTLQLRDAYQLIQHENNEAAFFAHTVVLVEGDSDTFTFPHLARLFNSEWNADDKNIVFVKTDGKGNLQKYREFFSSFDIPVHIITDLDTLLEGCQKLTTNAETMAARSALLTAIDAYLHPLRTPRSRKLRSITKSDSASALWRIARQHIDAWKQSHDEEDVDTAVSALEELFARGDTEAKLEAIGNPRTPEIEALRDDVIEMFGREQVYILRRGDLEDYCGTRVSTDKVKEAIEFCERTTDLESFLALQQNDAQKVESELRSIFSRIYE